MHLVQTGIYEVVGAVKQRAVGGQYGHKAFAARLCHKPGKMRVQSGFAHKVKIEKFYLALQSIGKQVKFVDGHNALCPIGLRAEEAIEVADIGDFEVAARYHNRGIKKSAAGSEFYFLPYAQGGCARDAVFLAKVVYRGAVATGYAVEGVATSHGNRA